MEAGFWDHIEALRQTVLRCLAVIAIGFCLALAFHQPLLQLITFPLEGLQKSSIVKSDGFASEEVRALATTNHSPTVRLFKLPVGGRFLTPESVNQQEQKSGEILLEPGESVAYLTPRGRPELLLLGPVEGIGTVIRVSCWLGLVATSPLWLFFILQFVGPGLKGREKGVVIPFLTLSSLFISAGMALAFFITIPVANHFLYLFNSEIGSNAWTLSSYLDYTILLVLANGLAFELFVLLLFLIHFGHVSAEGLARKRRLMIVLIFTLAAILTPPDVVTQCLLALPMLVLYEIGIVYARIRQKKTAGAAAS